MIANSTDSSVIFYVKDNNKYKKDYQIPNDEKCCSIIQKQKKMKYAIRNIIIVKFVFMI